MPLESDDETLAEEEAASLDRISALPDEVIHHVLGLLPAPEAVRTSVLARGWRHHWKSMRSLQLTVSDGMVLSADWLNRFMGRLLRDLRAPLDVCDIYVEEGLCDDVTALDAYRWVRQAVSKHHARELMVDLELAYEQSSFALAGQPLVSRHLTRLELYYVLLKGRVLDFSRCTALEDLVLCKCDIDTNNISSQSLKHLRIEHCDFCRKGSPTCISAPNLVSLKLEHPLGAVPVLQMMPVLKRATVELQCNHYYNFDYPCHKSERNRECCGLCEGCTGSDAHSRGCCMLFHGLSSATHLELIVPLAKFTDFKCYPTFSKLRTLLLGEWCLAANLHALICILQHAPVLENLTIELKGLHKNTMELEGSNNPTLEMPAVSEHLMFMGQVTKSAVLLDPISLDSLDYDDLTSSLDFFIISYYFDSISDQK
ncbi:hypothetical protein EJB05_28939, partial [Eragrostis curvula]